MPSFKSYQEKTRKGQRAQLEASVKRAEDAGTLVPESERFVGIEPDVKPIPYRSSPEEKERMRVVSKMMPTFERFKQFQARTLPVTAREPGRTEPSKPDELPGRDIPVIGHVLRALDYIGEHGPSGAVAEYAQPEPMREEFLRQNHQEPATGVNKLIGQVVAPFVQPGGGVGVGVSSLYRGAGAALNKLTPGLERTLGGRVAGEAIHEAAVGAPTAGAQALTRTGNTEQAAKEAAIGGGVGALGGAAGPLVGAGIRRGFKAFKASQSTAKPVEAVSPAPTPVRPTEDVAAESAPAMKGNWFTNLFGDVGVGITPFGSSKRVGNKPLTTKDAIVNKAIKNDRDSIGAEIAAGARSTYQNFVDALSPLKRVSSDTYDTAMDAARANMIANNIIGKDFVTPEGVRIGDGLETIFKKVGRGRDSDFIDYLTLRDAETRVGRGERVYDESLGMTPEKIAERIQMYNKRHPEFAAIAKDWDTFTKNVRETFGLKEGLLNEAQIAAMEESRPFYTPMRRQFNRSEKPGRKFMQRTSGASFSGQKAPIKKVSPTGSVRGIVDPRKTMIEAVGSFANAAMRNRAGQQLLNAIRSNPEGMRGIGEIVTEGTTNTAQATQKSIDEINEIIKNEGMEGLLEKLNSEYDLAFRKGTSTGTTDNVVTVMEKGVPVKIRLHDPEVFKAIANMSPQQSGLIVDLLTMFSNATKRGATGALAPLFAARSVTVDLVQALIQSRNPARHGADLVHAIFSSIGDKLGIPVLRNLAREYRLSGGGYSAALRGERKLNKGLGRLKRDPILSPQNIGRQTLRAAASPIKLGEAISDVSENVNRIAAYKDVMRRLGGERTPENVRKAINASREITTNFSRKGAYSKELEALFPYQNAAVQGTYRIMRGFKENPVKTTAAVFALAIAPKLAEYAHFHDDPDYQKIPARERMRNLIISKNDDGTFVKIPMDPAYNSFGEMTIQTMRYLKDNDPEAFKGTLDALANAWTPPLLTGALQGATQGSGIEGSIGGTLNAMSPAPVFATAYNQSFTGAPIVPQRLQDRSAKNQFDELTSFPAKWVGEKLGLAPMKVDYLLRAYGGDSARLLLPLTSDMGAGTTRNTLLKNFIVDPEFTNTLADDFYSAKERFINAKADQKVGDPLPVWYTAELDKLITSRAKGMPYRRITDLTAKKREVTGNRSLSASDKAQQLRDIQAQINEIYLDVNSKLSTAGVPMPNR